MKESISYSFLLNIVILFIFVCFAVVMGVLSYYKAFRANTIIANAIEKYEGYNCLSKEEIGRKLTGIGYNTPFKVECKAGDKNCNDEGYSYKIISYNLDFDGNLIYDENMNSTYKCDENGCTTNKHYQYGIFTYMYTELPVISGLIKLPFFSKTSTMYEFRNFYVENINGKQAITDTSSIFDDLYTKKIVNKQLYVEDKYKGTENIESTNNSNNESYVLIEGAKSPDEAGNTVTTTLEELTAEGPKSVREAYANIMFNNYIKLATTTTQQSSDEWIFMQLTSTVGKDYRVRAMYTNFMNGRTEIAPNIITSNILDGGLNGGYMRRECGYTFDYGKVNF